MQRAAAVIIGLVIQLSHALPPTHFPQAKRLVYHLFDTHPQTLYCHCTYTGHAVDLASCGMEQAQTKARASR